MGLQGDSCHILNRIDQNYVAESVTTSGLSFCFGQSGGLIERRLTV